MFKKSHIVGAIGAVVVLWALHMYSKSTGKFQQITQLI